MTGQAKHNAGPLEILYEIEQLPKSASAINLIDVYHWNRLRTALEAQADYIELLRFVEADKEAECREQFIALEEKDARIARLEAEMQSYLEFRGHCNGMKGTNRGLDSMLDVLNELPRQSAAAIKAELLRENAEHLRGLSANAVQNGYPEHAEGMGDAATELEEEADRIEREPTDAP